MARYKAARLFRLMATSGWVGPRVCSEIASARFKSALGRRVVAFRTVELSQIVQARGHVGVMRTNMVFGYLKSLLGHDYCLVIVPGTVKILDFPIEGVPFDSRIRCVDTSRLQAKADREHGEAS
jgi:hypothetical protein